MKRVSWIALLLAALLLAALFIVIQVTLRTPSSSALISTVAGTVDLDSGFSGDGGAATAAKLDGPCDVAVDGAGNLFIADSDNHRIRKVDTAGIITTFAGSDAIGFRNGGFSGDGDVATAAQLNQPCGIAIDRVGNLFIADTWNNRIRKVDTAGIITTFAGSGAIGLFNGGFSGDGDAATAAQLNSPRGVAVDSAGNLFIADTGNSRIRKVDTAGIITTVAGTDKVSLGSGDVSGDGDVATAAQLAEPHDVVVDSAGNLFIADTGNSRIRKVDTAGIITTVAGSDDGIFLFLINKSIATNAQLFFFKGVALDSTGNLFIADTLNNSIRKVVFPDD